METDTPVVGGQKNIFSSPWFRIIVGIIGVALIITGLMKIFVPKTKVSAEFINKNNEIGVLAKDIADNATLKIDGLAEKETAKDYKGAIVIVDGAITQAGGLVTKVDTLVTKLAELKTIAQTISDSAVRESALKRSALVEENNGHLYNVLDYEKQLLNLLKTYYQSLDAGKIPAVPDIAAINEKITLEAQEMKDLQVKINAANDEFAKLAGIKITNLK